MHNSRKVFLLDPEPRCVLGAYDENSQGEPIDIKEFKTFDPEVKVGDVVLVPTTTRLKMTVVKITEVDVEPDLDSNNQMHWIIGRVDDTVYQDTMKSEQNFLEAARSAEKRRRKAELTKDFLADMDTSKIKVIGTSFNNISDDTSTPST